MWVTLGIIVVLAGIIGVAWTIYRQEELDEREEELDKYSAHLDERANRLAADEETTKELFKQLQEELKQHNQ